METSPVRTCSGTTGAVWWASSTGTSPLRSIRPWTWARTWWRTFGIEQIVAAVLNDDPHDSPDAVIDTTVRWLEQTTEG